LVVVAAVSTAVLGAGFQELFAPASAQGTSSTVVQISGFGFGHGRGMGQWGAFGYASRYGWGYQQILSHYYGGATIGVLPAPEPDITVHLVEVDGYNTIASAVSGGQLVASWPGGGPVAAGAVEVTRSAGVQAVFSSTSCSGPWRPVGTTTAPVTLAGAQAASGSGVPASVAASELEACVPGTGGRIYQGDLVALPSGQTDNVVALEDYVDGVVPAESPADWASQGGEAALEAQAVAARSYALATVASSGVICDDTACQMYTGLPDQYGLTADAAVASTAGQVLYCDAGSSCGPAGSIALTEYSASTGGYTAGGAFPAVPDLGDSVAANPVHAWTVDIPVDQVESALPSVGALEAIDVLQRNGLGAIGGRVEQLSVSGTAGSVSLTGEQFAADLSLRSNWFDVALLAGPTPSPTTTPPSSSTTPPSTSTTSTSTTTVPQPPAVPTTSPPPAEVPPGGGPDLGPDDGYWVANSQGDVTAYGAARFYGTAEGTTIEGKVTAMAATPDYKGYWLAGSNGGVLAFGDAHWYGSASKLHIAAPVVGMAATADGRGYWLVSRDGGVFAYGDAVFYGSSARVHLNESIVGIAATPDGLGYWLVASDGGIFAFGDARFFGSAGSLRLHRPITGIVPSTEGLGYSLVAEDGGVFAFGQAPFEGSLPSKGIAARVVAVAPTYNGAGYYDLTADGEVYAFGDAPVPRNLVPAVPRPPYAAVAIVCHRSEA
jgi:SpoIID/LytB domain protein